MHRHHEERASLHYADDADLARDPTPRTRMGSGRIHLLGAVEGLLHLFGGEAVVAHAPKSGARESELGGLRSAHIQVCDGQNLSSASCKNPIPRLFQVLFACALSVAQPAPQTAES